MCRTWFNSFPSHHFLPLSWRVSIQTVSSSSSSNNDNGIKSTAEMGSGCEVSGDVGTGTIVGHGTTHGAAEEQSPNAWDC